MSEVKPNVRAIADNLKKDHTVSDKGVIEFTTAKEAFTAALPADLTFEQVEKTQAFLIDATAGVHLATGELALPLLKKGTERVRAAPRLGYSKIESKFGQPRSGVSVSGTAWKTNNNSKIEMVVGYGTRAKPMKEVDAHLDSLFDKAYGN